MEKRTKIVLPCSIATLISFILLTILWLQGMTELSFIGLWLLSTGWSVLAISLLFTDMKKTGKSIKEKLVYPSFFIILAIWLIRYAVGLNGSIYSDAASMNWIERFFDSLVHALQTFSMDEDYTTYLSEGKEFIYSNHLGTVTADVYGFYAALLNTLAPIAGGAILFDILTDIFPNIRLYYHSLKHNKKSFIFSELNSRAIVLAEDIRKHYPKAFILFTDAYVSPADEFSSELLIRAQKINALCLTTDLTVLNYLGQGPVEYYLIDNSDENNMETLTEMFTGKLGKHFINMWKKNANKTAEKEVDIFIFSGNPTVYQMVEHFNQLCEEENLNQVLIQVVNEYENLIYELLDTHPLYLPLLTNHNNELSIVLTGGGHIGKQFIKSAYWCGQMLNPYVEQNTENPEKIKLHFHIIAKNSTELKQQLILDMPEAFDSKYCALDEQECTGEKPYASFSFHTADVNSCEYEAILNEIPHIDYVLVALGSDKRNLSASHWLKKYLDKRSLTQGNPSYIHCIIEDTNLKNTISGIFQQQKPMPVNDICFLGSLDERYKYHTIHQTRFAESACLVDIAHKDKTKRDFLTDMYNFRSSIASAMHLKYRIFSAGLIEQNSDITLENLSSFFTYMLNPVHVNLQLWCEKQRWNAYTRSIGLSCPNTKQFLNFYRIYGGIELHKANPGKKNLYNLHCCLMECSAASGIVLNDQSLIPYDCSSDVTPQSRSQSLMEILNQLANKQNYDLLYQQLQKSKDNLSKNKGICNNWPPFLDFQELCRNYPTLPDLMRLITHIYGTEVSPLDSLDRLSALRGTDDYKNYDYNQVLLIPLHQIQTMIYKSQQILDQNSHYSEKEKEQARKDQNTYLKTLQTLQSTLVGYRKKLSIHPCNDFIEKKYQMLLNSIENELKKLQNQT